MGRTTKPGLLDILKREGPKDAATLAGRLGITPAAVGLQLASLRRKGLVSPRPLPREPGRRGPPMRGWELTEEAQAAFPDSHGPLSAALLAALGSASGLPQLRKFLRARARLQAAQYRALFGTVAPLRARVRALAKVRDAEGYMTEVRIGPAGSVELVENHCPICAAARACPGQGLCEAERAVFQKALGPGTIVRREEHILTGARRCVYSIRAGAGGKG